ncbi:MAG TPA: Hpt domain-containing protein, partial [Polyangiales bacterium]|nr:Hpt domain-containing protein [Polyangiales bacterium]
MTTGSDGLDRDEFVAGYLIEADEHLRSAVANLLAVEQALRSDAPQHRLVRELFRSLHTLKGLSAMVGVDAVVDLAHEMETILRDADRRTGKLSGEAMELLLKGVRAIEQRVTAFAKKKPVAPAPRKLLEALADLKSGSDAGSKPSSGTLSLDPALLDKLAPVEREQLAKGLASGLRALRIDFHPSPDNTAQGISITTVREAVGALGEIVRVIPCSVTKSETAPGGLAFALLVLTRASDEELTRATRSPASSFVPITLESRPESQPDAARDFERYDDEHEGSARLDQGSIRVQVARLDEALERLSALVVTRFKLMHAVGTLRERGVDVRELSAILAENHRQLRDLRGAITRARMVSVAELLERVPLIVRGMSRTTGKHVQLVVDAGKAELDKAVAERIFPAIVHLVRNAVDHALESPAERRAAGKPEVGLISVSCVERADNRLELTLSDDGRGVDAVAVARRAQQPVPQTDDALLELL